MVCFDCRIADHGSYHTIGFGEEENLKDSSLMYDGMTFEDGIEPECLVLFLTQYIYESSSIETSHKYLQMW